MARSQVRRGMMDAANRFSRNLMRMTRWMTWWMMIRINLSQSNPGSATGTGLGEAGGAPPRKKSRPSIKRITIV